MKYIVVMLGLCLFLAGYRGESVGSDGDSSDDSAVTTTTTTTTATTTTPCICQRIYAPVCGADNVLYSNECEMNCNNVIANTNTTACGSNSNGNSLGKKK